MSAPLPRNDAPLWRRLLWFAAMWAAGVGAVALVSLVLRFWIGPH